MIAITIPGHKQLRLDHAVFDVNGTLAMDGELLPGVELLLDQLGQQVQIHLLTADTHGKQAAIDAQLGLKAQIITRGAAQKADYVRELGAAKVVAIGNGANDVKMCEIAGLSIAIMGPEGVAGELVRTADVLVRSIDDALELLLHPQRVRATLRR
jgi:soluble P-type ATPase